MGCDIHIMIEIKEAGQKDWHLDPQHLNSPYPDEVNGIRDVTAAGRWYTLFGVLSNVR